MSDILSLNFNVSDLEAYNKVHLPWTTAKSVDLIEQFMYNFEVKP